MTSNPIITRLCRLTQFNRPQAPQSLSYWGRNQRRLPRFVRHSPVAMRYLHLLAPLAWEQLPPRPPQPHDQQPALSYATLAAVCLIKLDQQLVSMGKLRDYLLEHPALGWLVGVPVCPTAPLDRTKLRLPTQRHLTRLLRTTPNAVLQLLLESTVHLLQAEVTDLGLPFGQTIALDTKHIIAWVKENNPKAYHAKGRYDKTKQPAGDHDCKLGCKRQRNQRASSKEPPPTPTAEPVPADILAIGEYYWGYGSGVVVTKIPGWGEVVLAELTLPFDQADVAYFFPLLRQTELRLGFRPHFGALDAAFDAFYVHEFFHSDQHDGFAAVPFSERGGYRRAFDDQGLPLCQAGLAMPLKYTFWSKTALIHHQRGRHVCPLLFPEPTGRSLSSQPQTVGQRRLYHHHADLYRRPAPLSTRPRQRPLQAGLQPAHGQRTHQQPGQSPGH